MTDQMSEYSIAEARDHFTELVHKAEQGKPVALTRRGRPVAVILSIRAYQHMTRHEVDFWKALTEFRKAHDLQELNLGPDVFGDARDRSIGREVNL
jgi:prevent-host-death family protein